MTGRKHSFQLDDFLSHILEAVDRIAEYTNGLTYSDFCRSTRDQDAVIRNFEVIGEACRNIDQNYPDFVAAHPELPIRSAYDMRNALSHGYFGVDLDIVWRAILHDLPSLKRNLLAVLPPRPDPGPPPSA
jgi:uncharacterized protein with HEPN domain